MRGTVLVELVSKAAQTSREVWVDVGVLLDAVRVGSQRHRRVGITSAQNEGGPLNHSAVSALDKVLPLWGGGIVSEQSLQLGLVTRFHRSYSSMCGKG